ncbi:MAG: alpha/beta fold hydrolase [Actinomycetota bacterium]
MTPGTRYATTGDGVQIAWQAVGEGWPDIVYAGGFATHVELVWEQPWIARYFSNVASIGRLILFDKRGSGLSERASPLCDLETRADDLRAVLDATGSERAVLVGQGEGGALVSFFAATYPERTIGLVWIGPQAKTGWSPDYEFGWSAEDEARSIEWIRSSWGTPAHAREFLAGDAPSLAADDEWVEWLAKFFRYSMSPGEALRFEQMWYDTDARAILPAVNVPTLLICPNIPISDGTRPVESARYVAERIAGSRLVELPPGDWWPVSPQRQDLVVDELRMFVEDLSAERSELNRVLTTIVFTDIVKSTEKAAGIGDGAWRQLLERHHTVVRGLLGRYHGVEVDTAGDGFLATFDGPARAVRCASAIVGSVGSLGLEVRAGVHTGEIELDKDGVKGIAVHIGARIAGFAGASEVWASSTVKDLTAGSGLSFEDRGMRALKGVPDEWHLYKVAAGLSTDIGGG